MPPPEARALKQSDEIPLLHIPFNGQPSAPREINFPYEIRERIFLALVNLSDKPAKAYQSGRLAIPGLFSKIELKRGIAILKPLARLLKAESNRPQIIYTELTQLKIVYTKLTRHQIGYSEQLSALTNAIAEEHEKLSNNNSQPKNKNLITILDAISALSREEQLELFSKVSSQTATDHTNPSTDEFSNDSQGQLLEDLLKAYSQLHGSPALLQKMQQYFELKLALLNKIMAAQEFVEFCVKNRIAPMRWFSLEIQEFYQNTWLQEIPRKQKQIVTTQTSTITNALTPDERAHLLHSVSQHSTIINRQKNLDRKETLSCIAPFITLLCFDIVFIVAESIFGNLDETTRSLMGILLAFTLVCWVGGIFFYASRSSAANDQEQEHRNHMGAFFRELHTRPAQVATTPSDLENGVVIREINEDTADAQDEDLHKNSNTDAQNNELRESSNAAEPVSSTLPSRPRIQGSRANFIRAQARTDGSSSDSDSSSSESSSSSSDSADSSDAETAPLLRLQPAA